MAMWRFVKQGSRWHTWNKGIEMQPSTLNPANPANPANPIALNSITLGPVLSFRLFSAEAPSLSPFPSPQSQAPRWRSYSRLPMASVGLKGLELG